MLKDLRPCPAEELRESAWRKDSFEETYWQPAGTYREVIKKIEPGSSQWRMA